MSRQHPLVDLVFRRRRQGDPQNLRDFFLDINNQLRLLEAISKPGIFLAELMVLLGYQIMGRWFATTLFGR